jgi:hypothetical protein
MNRFFYTLALTHARGIPTWWHSLDKLVAVAAVVL